MIKDELQQILKTQLLRMTKIITNPSDNNEIKKLMKTQADLQSLIETGVFIEDDKDEKVSTSDSDKPDFVVDNFLHKVQTKLEQKSTAPVISMHFQVTFTGGILLPKKRTNGIPPYIIVNEQFVRNNELQHDDTVDIEYYENKLPVVVSVTHSTHPRPNKFAEVEAVIKSDNHNLYVDRDIHGDSLLSLTSVRKYILPEAYVKSSDAKSGDIITLRYDRFKNYPTFRCIWLQRQPRHN